MKVVERKEYSGSIAAVQAGVMQTLRCFSSDESSEGRLRTSRSHYADECAATMDSTVRCNYSGRKSRSRYADERAAVSRYSRRANKNADAAPRSRYADKNQPTSGHRKKKNRSGGKSALYICIIIFLVLAIACIAGTLYWYKWKESAAPQVSIELESLDSPYAVLIDADTAAVIGTKNSDEQIYPASMTKIMTVLVAIESIDNLDETTTMSADFYDELYAQDASRAGFEPGEEAVIRDLLYGALLPSGAECCMQLAILAADSEEAFAELMNQRAEKLGLTQTNFVNCTGLHDENQYTTAYEMALILREALENDTFREVITTHYYTVSATSVHPDGFTFWSTLFKAIESEEVTGGEILAGKTGYTQEAGLCLASMAQIGEREYILVTAGWTSNADAGQYHISDAFTAYNMLGEALGYGTGESSADDL